MADRQTQEEREPLLSRRSSYRSTTIFGSSCHQSILLDQRPAWKKKLACAAVLITVILERIAFYSVAGNLVLFLNKMPLEWVSYDASTAVFVFLGTSLLVSPLFGWLADTCLGRFWTVSLSLVMYIVGYAFMPMIAHPEFDVRNFCSIIAWERIFYPEPSDGTFNVSSGSAPFCSWLVYFSLIIVAMASGGVKANIAPFGADQVCS